MSEIKPTEEHLSDPYVLQLIEALSKQDDEIKRLQDILDRVDAAKEAEIERLQARAAELEAELAARKGERVAVLRGALIAITRLSGDEHVKTMAWDALQETEQ